MTVLAPALTSGHNLVTIRASLLTQMTPASSVKLLTGEGSVELRKGKGYE
jgi:hypothetical protein